MAISLNSLMRGSVSKVPITLIHASGGVGKTTFAASAPSPVFIQTEDGLHFDVPTFGLLRSFDDVLAAIGSLYSEPHNFQTVVIDSIDWLEPLIWAETARRNGWKDIEQPGYGKGYVAALDAWRSYIEGITALRDERGLTVVQIAHTDVKRFDSPEHEPYDRYVIKLQAKASALLVEHCDIVGFLNYRISTVKSDVGFNKKVVRAVGQGMRSLYVEERPAFVAKNRYSMPDSIDLPDVKGNDPALWAAFAQHIPALSSQARKEAA
jgi:hypothetical protein